MVLRGMKRRENGTSCSSYIVDIGLRFWLTSSFFYFGNNLELNVFAEDFCKQNHKRYALFFTYRKFEMPIKFGIDIFTTLNLHE